MPSEKERLIKKRDELYIELATVVLSSSYEPIVGMKERKALISLEEECARLNERKREKEAIQEKRDKIISSLEQIDEKRAKLKEDLDEKYSELCTILLQKRKSESLDLRVIEILDVVSSEKKSFKDVILSSIWKDNKKEKISQQMKKLFDYSLENTLSSVSVSLLDDIINLRERLRSQDEAYLILNKKLHESESAREVEERKEAEEEKRVAQINYGEYLFENGAKWIEEDTPESILDAISALLRNEDEIKEEEKREIRELSLIKAGELEEIIKDTILRIDALEGEKERIEGKIAALRAEIKELEREKSEMLERSRG